MVIASRLLLFIKIFERQIVLTIVLYVRIAKITRTYQLSIELHQFVRIINQKDTSNIM